MRTAQLPLLLTAAILACVAPARAESESAKDKDDDVRYLLGASLAVAPEYDGASRQKFKIRPLWAARFGRIRIATSGGSALLGFGRENVGAGASAQLVENDRWRVGVSLRFDSGRDSGDARTTQGLPDVKRTLRAKLSATYSFTPDWNISGSLSQDVLGHRGGLTAGLDLGWRFYRSETTEWTTGVGLSAANALNMRSYFGVPASAVAESGKPAYEPGAGLRDAHVGVGFKHALDGHWFLFGSTGASRLMGPAADSPLVQRRSGFGAAVGVAWRN
jgi:outer membrane scaffolding protein for murein synthesis (MipA/OmpV family)